MGKKLRNLIGTLLLVTAIAVTQIPVPDVEAETAASTSDDAETAASDEVTTSASDFQMDGTTLVKYNGTAADVSISGYVEKIESEAFAGNNSVRRITLGDSVEVIGARAFSGCNNLESISIPDSVTTIENAAFSGCPGLRSVTVGTGLKSLGNGAFAGDYSLANVAFDEDNPWFVCDDGAIYNKKGGDILYQVLAGRKAPTYVMPSSVTQIKPYAFWGDYYLENAEISSNVKEISGYAFSNCKNLKDITVPYSVKNIDMKAFEDCVRLRDITLPASVSTIHSTAFDGCTKLTIHAEPGSYAKSFADSLVLEDIDVSEYEEAPVPVEESKDDGENGEDEVAQVLSPADYYHEVSRMNPMAEEEDASVKAKTRVIGQEAYVLVDNAKATVNVGGTGEKLGGDPEADVEVDLDTVPGLEGSDDAKGGSFPKYTVVNKEIIAAQAYYDDEMTSYEVPDGIRRIGEFAFARAELNAIRIPDSVEEIGYAAFYHCDNLTNVVIPSGVKEIGVAAFAKTPWLEQWKTSGSGDFLIVGDGILLAYRGAGGMVSIPGNVRQIGAEAFLDQKNITGVQIPGSVEVIGEAAFSGCNGLSTIEGADGVKEIRDRAFAGCPLKTVRIPGSVEKIGLRAFDGAADSVIVFEGNTLPRLSYETTATKLYRDTYRGMCFPESKVAVIPDGVTDLTDTVLAADVPGFKGVVCKRAGQTTGNNTDAGVQDADKSQEKADTLKEESEEDSLGKSEEKTAKESTGKSTSEEKTAKGSNGKSTEESAGQSTAEEGGSLYILLRRGSGPAAGDSCEINGKSYVLEEGREKLADAETENGNSSGILVANNSRSIAKDGAISAVMEGGEGGYQIVIEDSEEARNQIGDVYRTIYGNKIPYTLHGYEISMMDSESRIPITSLGKQRVELTMPIPAGVGQENLHVVCLDADGQLEEVESRIVSVNGQDMLAFTAAHFSPYGIYNYNSNSTVVSDVKEGQAVFMSLGKKDDSPDTGDHSIHPKWFFGAGLFFASMAVFFYRGGRRRRKKLFYR